MQATHFAPPELYRASLLPSGQVFTAPSDQPLLLAAQASGITLPGSCRNGTCRACICQLASGRVSYRIAWPSLSTEEKREGFILP